MICNESTKFCCTWECSTLLDGRLGGPFIGPREHLDVCSSNGKQLAFPICVCTMTVRCGLVTVGEVQASPADCAANRWRGRDWLTGQFGAHRIVR
jgi:hypothetical protein